MIPIGDPSCACSTCRLKRAEERAERAEAKLAEAERVRDHQIHDKNGWRERAERAEAKLAEAQALVGRWTVRYAEQKILVDESAAKLADAEQQLAEVRLYLLPGETPAQRIERARERAERAEAALADAAAKVHDYDLLHAECATLRADAERDLALLQDAREQVVMAAAWHRQVQDWANKDDAEDIIKRIDAAIAARRGETP